MKNKNHGFLLLLNAQIYVKWLEIYPCQSSNMLIFKLVMSMSDKCLTIADLLPI